METEYSKPDWKRIAHLAGNNAWAYALSTGWLSVGSLITFTGLLLNMPKE